MVKFDIILHYNQTAVHYQVTWYENLKPSKTRGEHRKRMKRRFSWKTYHQRSKVETIFSVIKGMRGDSVMSRSIMTQNRETLYRVIAYNCYRITSNYFVIFGCFLHGCLDNPQLISFGSFCTSLIDFYQCMVRGSGCKVFSPAKA